MDTKTLLKRKDVLWIEYFEAKAGFEITVIRFLMLIVDAIVENIEFNWRDYD